jgi:general secretion pathway protein K
MKPSTQARQRGAALLLAMIVLTLISTVAAGMVWQQSRAIQIEAAERARAQAGWMLNAGVDFAREVVRRYGNADPRHDQPWDSELAETRLSALLAADRDNSADASLEAFISGRVDDAQSRYNLRNLASVVPKGEPNAKDKELRTLQRLCETIGLSGVAETLAAALRASWAVAGAEAGGSETATALAPGRLDQLSWLGLDAATIARLSSFVTLLPEPTPINLNTASAEVIFAVVDGLDLATAARLVRNRSNRFADLDQVKGQLGSDELKAQIDGQRVAVKSSFFEVSATVRFEDRALTDLALLQRGNTGEVTVLRRERRPRALGGGA